MGLKNPPRVGKSTALLKHFSRWAGLPAPGNEPDLGTKWDYATGEDRAASAKRGIFRV
jgi:hypothetical protein